MHIGLVTEHAVMFNREVHQDTWRRELRGLAVDLCCTEAARVGRHPGEVDLGPAGHNGIVRFAQEILNALEQQTGWTIGNTEQ
jgi:hypothetical protein